MYGRHADPRAGGGRGRAHLRRFSTCRNDELFPISVEREPEFRRRLRQRTAATGRRVGDAQHRLHLLWSDALRHAAIAFAARLKPPCPSPAMRTMPDLEALRGLYNSWVDCAEEAYARVAHGDSFVGALADFMNASSEWRKESRASIE